MADPTPTAYVVWDGRVALTARWSPPHKSVPGQVVIGDGVYAGLRLVLDLDDAEALARQILAAVEQGRTAGTEVPR